MGFICLIITPAILMGLAIFAAPHLARLLHALSRQNLVAGVGLVFLLGSVAILMMPSYIRRSAVAIIQVFGPIPSLTGIAGFLIQSGLHSSRGIRWWRIGVATPLLLLACFLLWDVASLGRLGPLFALLIGFSATGVAVVTGAWVAWSLPRWRKLAALLIGVILPLLFFASVQMGEAQSPEEVTQSNGDLIVQALEMYRAEIGTYPADLTELVPVYLTELPLALTTQGTGWLYTSDGGKYTLGYWHYPRKFGVTLCLYSSDSDGWQCKFTYQSQDWAPFSPVPTPTPGS